MQARWFAIVRTTASVANYMDNEEWDMNSRVLRAVIGLIFSLFRNQVAALHSSNKCCINFIVKLLRYGASSLTFLCWQTSSTSIISLQLKSSLKRYFHLPYTRSRTVAKIDEYRGQVETHDRNGMFYILYAIIFAQCSTQKCVGDTASFLKSALIISICKYQFLCENFYKTLLEKHMNFKTFTTVWCTLVNLYCTPWKRLPFQMLSQKPLHWCLCK